MTSIRAVTKNTIAVGCGNGDLCLFHVEGHIVTPKSKTTLCGGITSLSVSTDEKEILAATTKGFVYRVRESGNN